MVFTRKLSIIGVILFIIDRQDKVRTAGSGSAEQNNIGKEDVAESMAFVI